MERECMRKKRESLEERRSPLQNLNGLPIRRRNTKKNSPISSSSSSAPAASRSSLSVNNTSSSTPFSHSSKTHFHNKQNPFPKTAKFKPNVPTSRKPFLQTSRKGLEAKPTCKNRQRSKLSPVHGKSEKGSQEFQKKMKISDGFVYERGEAANDVKTPPVEASLSPEIQCQSQSRMVVLKSVGTPVLYGAGCLVSGVSDRRKSKLKGSLKGWLQEKGDLFSDENVSGDLQVPLLAEASVRWHLSPCDLRNRFGQDRNVCDDDSGTVDSLSLPSILCDKSSYSGNGSVRNVEIDRSNVADVLTKNLECNMDESLACLNSGNMIQTPDSDSSSGTRFGRSRFKVNLSNSFWPDSITEKLEGVKLSPRNEVSMWGGLGSHSVDICSPPVSLDPTRIEKNVDSVSDTTSDNLTLSHMKISWCEGLASEFVEADEFDCCCLSDEEIDGDKACMVVGSVEHKDDGFRIGNEHSPVILDYEPCLPAERKVKSFSIGSNACTDGGGLLASVDSDWRYLNEKRTFRAT
ncbi:uncharacterized protein LOC121802989 isoform X1 [Salvia splendens]|uniref:uncharacterized protein LOC121802989 isoform X1 n=1 Tax=Salvia splendens TaxID=180675 RepID=UPI001C27EFFD|nr:uncharacterized protein LOC121802989 isoform X1 [Salvia splendens]